MNWLDGLALLKRLRGFYARFGRAPKGKHISFLIRSRIEGRMWSFKGEAWPED